jgi:biopolymer transport protein ExbB
MQLDVFYIIAMLIYTALALIALWGVFCVVMVWQRVAQKRFRTEAQQSEFLDALEGPLKQGDFDAVVELCSGDRRATPQLVELAVANRGIGFAKVRALVMDRFQRDVLADLEYRLSWVSTVIKTAPMIGLFGTVLGMMGAFATLASAENVDPTQLADDINVALRTTACGLAIAIPLVLCMASVNVRIRKMEDLVASGLTRFLDVFRSAPGVAGRSKG